VVDD
jgi:hypothetical protein